MIMSAFMVVPSSSLTEFLVTDATLVLNLISVDASRLRICRGTASMPFLGMVIIPCDIAENVNDAKAERSLRCLSRVMPANSGCRNDD